MSAKPDLRWQLLLAGIAAVLVAFLLALSFLPSLAETTPLPANNPTRIAASGNNDENAPLCETPASETALVPQVGGVVREGVVGAPRYLNPLLSDGNPIDEELVSLLFDGLTRYDENGRLVGALAEGWQVSEDGLTVVFTLRPGLTWHDGEPVTAEDVAFTYGLLQASDFPDTAVADQALWQAVSINVLNEREISFTLPNAYAPFLAATTRGILPAHLLASVPASSLANHPFNAVPVGTGPFMVGNNWQQAGELLLTPKPGAWPVPPYLDGLVVRFYADEEALLAAYTAGELDAVNRLSATAVADALVLPNMRLYTTPRGRYAQLLFNLTENGHPALDNLDVRLALTQALDKQAIIDTALTGQALPFEGPYLPQSFAYNPNLPATLPYNPDEANQRLDTAGWTMGETGPFRTGGEDGDVPLGLTLLAYNTPANRALVEQITEQWRAVGVEVFWSLTDDLSTFQASLADRSFDVALVDVTPPGDPDLYDFWSQEAIVDGQNFAGWNRRRASEALEAARQVWNQDERRAYYEAFLTFFDEDRPAVTLFQYVDNYGIHDGVQGVEIGEVQVPRDRYEQFAGWFLPDPTAVCE
ncbi:MAG: peptide ABC transporter substrate-binding protein [Anaerolineales bacterium]|nr:peptide ABC transporter substrate-binding protein [Anaerolineales bacterium]